MTQNFVKLSKVSNATIDITVTGVFRLKKSENVCGNAQIHLIRTKFIKGETYQKRDQRLLGYPQMGRGSVSQRWHTLQFRKRSLHQRLVVFH